MVKRTSGLGYELTYEYQLIAVFRIRISDLP